MNDQNVEDLHFDFSHLLPNQTFTLLAGPNEYVLAPHTPYTRQVSRRSTSVLGLIPDANLTHFAKDVAVPPGVALLRVSAPRLLPDEPLDRLIFTGIHVPRSHRAAGIATRRGHGAASAKAKLSAIGAYDNGMPPADEQLIDIGSFKDALDTAASLVFHHPEIMALHPEPAGHILSIVHTAAGLTFLAQIIREQAQEHEKDPDTPNWVVSQPGKDSKTGEPSGPIYVWSDETVEFLAQPLRDALMRTKNDPQLELQCWTVQRGVTEIQASTVNVVDGAVALPELTYTLKQITPQAGVVVAFESGEDGAGRLSITNSYLRWLQISLDQYGPGGEAIGSTTALGRVPPVDTIMAVPLPAQSTEFPIQFSSDASRASVSLGGLGQAPFATADDWEGITLTAIFNLALPAFFLVLGVAVDQLGNWATIQKKVVSQIASVIEAETGFLSPSILSEGTSCEDLLAEVGNMASSLILSVAASSEALQAYLAMAFTESAIEKAAPFIGWVAWGIGAAADVASIIETSVNVAASPATMRVDIVRTMNVRVAVNPDPLDPGHFPATATEYVITITYDDGPVYTYTGQLAPVTQQPPVEHLFQALPAGGTLTVLACFYSSTGWLAGKGHTQSIRALPTEGNTLIVPPFNIVEQLVPLTSDTTYHLKEKLAYRDGERAWVGAAESGPPSATVSDLDPANTSNTLAALTSLGLNEPQSAVGYVWEASGQNTPLNDSPGRYSGQMYTYQNVSDSAEPESGMKFCAYGYTARPLLAYPPPTAVQPAADGVLLEPPDHNNIMHLRELSLRIAEPFLSSPGMSFGRFVGPQDDLALHPSGSAVALSKDTCKLQILKLGALFHDDDAPTAAIRSGRGTRTGLLYAPVAVTCSLSTVFVLQSHPNYPQGCIAAFDLNGNPAPCFAENRSLTPLHFEAAQSVVVLDISVESRGYIYILKYLDLGSEIVAPGDYQLDIYQPDGNLLTQVSGLAAAKLQVDLWRNLYTLTYEIVQGTGRVEPSVAFWIPSTPGPQVILA